MRDQFVGDIGDYAKYSLFNTLAQGRKAGIAWYRTPDQPGPEGNRDSYLRSADWAKCDPEVFKCLKHLRTNSARSIAAIEGAGILKAQAFSGRLLELSDIPVTDRPAWRKEWFQATLSDLADCNFVFADPDNGLYSDERFSPARKGHLCYTPLSEARLLASERSTMIYHHHGFIQKSHLIHTWRSALGTDTIAIYFGAWGSRSFFITNPDAPMRQAIAAWAARWPKVEVFDGHI